jgi:hypothetical protein
LQNHAEKHAHQHHEKELLNVVDDLSRFIIHEVVNVRGKFFDEAQDLATDDKYIELREWDNQLHHAASSTVPRED